MEYRKGRLRERLERARVPAGKADEIFASMEFVEQSITLPSDIFDALSPTVSPYRQQSLYERIRKGIKRKGKGPGYVLSQTPIGPRCVDVIISGI